MFLGFIFKQKVILEKNFSLDIFIIFLPLWVSIFILPFVSSIIMVADKAMMQQR